MSEDQYKRIADEYLREYGAGLRSELDDMERQPIIRDTRSLDRRVRSGIAALKRPQYMRYTGLIAACVVIALITTLVLRSFPGRVGAPAAGPDMYSPAPSAAPSPSSSAAPSAAPSTPPAMAPSGSPPAEAYEILPLSFNIPGQFSVASVEQDVNKTIYRLNDNRLDDVVITMELSGDISRYDELTEIQMGRGYAFASSGNGYNLLALRDDGSDILYTLTCKYDINTLVLLGNNILI